MSIVEVKAEVWRKAMNAAADRVTEVIKYPPARQPGETLTRWVTRVQDLQQRAIVRWQWACEEYQRNKPASKG
jgi:hypothetical protein